MNGTTYHPETPHKIKAVLEEARKYNTRIILDYGDPKTGQSWGEVYDIKGRVSRSMGPTKVPILLYNSRSIGGAAILDHCIVAIHTSKGKYPLYVHPEYKAYSA